MSRVCTAVCVALWLTHAAAAQPAVAPAAGHADAARALDAFIAAQVERHRLPALSVALVADQRIVWAKGYGFADPARKVAATAETIYRVGSVSKLFTDLAILQLAERDEIDIDADVTKYLPNFAPGNPFHAAITLRQLMSHKAGLVREPPVGSYFDPDNPSLAQTVASLNRTTLIHAPGTTTKYSNAGIAVVGRVLEKDRGEAFAKYLQRALLDPLGMKASSFEPTPAVRAKLARAVMWTYHGREFAAPTFELGMAPAGCMYSNVLDLSRFLSMLFAGGKAGERRILQAATLRAAMAPQFVKAPGSDGFGLGFAVGRMHGRRAVGHGGAVYGFATSLTALPDEKLGVVVIASCDCANAVTSRIGNVALGHLLAVQEKKPLPAIETTSPIPAETAKKLAGRWQGKTTAFDLSESAGRLFYTSQRGGFRIRLAQLGKDLVTDDRLGWGLKIQPAGDELKIGGETFRRAEVKRPADVPAKWRGLIGEYGWDHNVLYILEKDGKLHALIEWFFLDPLEEESLDVYRFPADRGLYPREKLVFKRDRSGKAVSVEAAGIVFRRRHLDGEDGKTFRIKPLRPVAVLRAEALKARPPAEAGVVFRKGELVDLKKVDPTIRLDVRYAGTNNFLSTPLYRSARAFLQRPAAEALTRVHKGLARQGFGLLVHDGYRPWFVTKVFWEATPPTLRTFVANPQDGSRHNRGCAVDLTLFDRKTGQAMEMVGGYDEMSDRSYPDYPGGTSLQRWRRDLLRRAMEAEGFTVYEAEWWHFDHKDWRKYPLGNQTFEELGK